MLSNRVLPRCVYFAASITAVCWVVFLAGEISIHSRNPEKITQNHTGPKFTLVDFYNCHNITQIVTFGATNSML